MVIIPENLKFEFKIAGKNLNKCLYSFVDFILKIIGIEQNISKIASRSQTMFFGRLVHQTIEDLHHFLIQERVKISKGD